MRRAEYQYGQTDYDAIKQHDAESQQQDEPQDVGEDRMALGEFRHRGGGMQSQSQNGIQFCTILKYKTRLLVVLAIQLNCENNRSISTSKCSWLSKHGFIRYYTIPTEGHVERVSSVLEKI